MIQGLATIRNPDGSVWQNYGVTLDESVTFDDARGRLMEEFAKASVGSTFGLITKNDAWNIWQMAERNGYHIQVVHIASDIQQTEIQQVA